MVSKEKQYKWRREDYQENTKGLLMVHTGHGKGNDVCGGTYDARGRARFELLHDSVHEVAQRSLLRTRLG
jgi:hypothetical protein